ncbi:unnamed protein product [Diplocarpon coronariae]|nr:hypothetical protein JHW43_001799 [Diplocarpon mali]
MSTEQNVAAIIEALGARLKIVNRPIPIPGPRELVVRNRAIAANPADWKLQDYGSPVGLGNYPLVLGSDSCGIVASVGASVTKFKVGDRVTGFAGVIYNNAIDHGAWQTYTVLRDIAAMKIPDSMSFEEGAVFPMAISTAGVALFVNLGIPRPSEPITLQASGFLVWGAASSVGTASVQLAKNLGFKVFATASPVHHEYLQSLGASEVFDYHDEFVVDKLVASSKEAGTSINFGFDTVGQGTSARQSAEILCSSGGRGGKLALVLPWAEDEAKPEGIEVSMVIAARTGMDMEGMGEWLFNDYLENALMQGSIVPAPKSEVFTGGIAVTQSVFDKLKAGVSGKKLVVKVDG